MGSFSPLSFSPLSFTIFTSGEGTPPIPRRGNRGPPPRPRR